MALDDLRIEEQDLTSGDLTLDAREGESLEILARGIDSGADEDVVEETIREETVLAYQADEGDDEIFPRDVVDNFRMDLLMKLREMGLSAPTLKIPEGQTYTLNNPNDNGSAVVVYQEHPPDFASGGPPGSPSNKTRVFISNGQTTQNIGAGATEVVDLVDSVNPGELSTFPYEEDAPSGFEFDMVAFMVDLDNSADADHTLDNVRMNTREQNFLARANDRIRNELAQYPADDLTTLPLVFDEPPTITPGQELDVEVEVTDSGGAAADTVVNSAFIFHRRVPGGGS